MPFHQRSAWLKAQRNDKTHQELEKLLRTSQSPEKKKTGGENSILKRLHNLYKKGSLKQEADGLFTVTQIDSIDGSHNAISIPSQLFPGLMEPLELLMK